MTHRSAKIDAYIDNAAEFARPVLNHLRELVHNTCPDVEEGWKWSFPHFMYQGAILCSMAAFKQHCSFGFWKSSLMPDPDHIFAEEERDGMGHLGKIYSLKDLPKDAILKKYIKAAMQLNEEGIKVQKKPKAEKAELETPDDLLQALKANKAAKLTYDAFSYSNKKDYVEWITEAKTEATRTKRLIQAIEWMAEGKTRHWKYQS
jgi:uncharacterized protein YdeI (YjbR/CyaY-like superfamily)